MAFPIDISAYTAAVTNEINVVVGAFKEKGAKRFGRRAGRSGVPHLRVLRGSLPAAPSRRARAAVRDQPRQAAGRLRRAIQGSARPAELAYAGLPSLKDREQWLSNSVRDSLLVGGLEPENFTPVKENELNGLVFQTSSVILTVRFSEFFDGCCAWRTRSR